MLVYFRLSCTWKRDRWQLRWRFYRIPPYVLFFFFEGRNSQFSKQAGCGAAGPVISWVTVMTDFPFFSFAPKHLLLQQPCLYCFQQLITPKSKLCEQPLLQRFAQEKEVLLWNSQEYTTLRHYVNAGKLQQHLYTLVLQTEIVVCHISCFIAIVD